MAGPLLAPRVRETSTTTGASDIILDGAMRGSLAFSQVLAAGDFCDICISYDNSFEECQATFQTGPNRLVRGTVYKSLHSGGVVDTNHVSFAAGVKTVILIFGSTRMSSFLSGAVRFDQAQTLTTPNKRQALDNLGLFPTGTKMLFMQAAAPPGWTLDVTHNDKALRIVNTAGGGTGGTSSFSTVFGKTATDGTALLQTHLPNVDFTVNIPSGQGSHNHTGTAPGSPGNQTAAGGDAAKVQTVGSSPLTINNNTLPAMSGTAASGGSNTVHTHPMDIRVNFVDGIICNKD